MNRRHAGLVLAALCTTALLTTTGCQAGRTYELATPYSGRSLERVVVRETASSVPICPSLKAHFEKTLAARLVERNGQVRIVEADASKDALAIEYRFILHDSGSAATRIGAAVVSVVGFPAGALGEGAVGVEVTFRDPAGEPVGHIVADGPIDGPVASTRSGLTTAATSIARYTVSNFAPPPIELSAPALATR